MGGSLLSKKAPTKCRQGSCDKPDSVFTTRSTSRDGGGHSSRRHIAMSLKRTYPEASCGPHSNASLFVLAPHRVWLFSLRQLLSDLPFPIEGSKLRTFSLFHCSSPCGGGSLTPVLPCGVRTFLNVFHQKIRRFLDDVSV